MMVKEAPMTRNVALRWALAAPFVLPAAFLIQVDAVSAYQVSNAPAASSSAQSGTPGAQPNTLPPIVRLYEGKNRSQNTVCTVSITQRPSFEMYHFKGNANRCKNDEAQSIEFERIPAGSVIQLFDDPECGKNDDWVEWTFFQEVAMTYSKSFEYSHEDSEFGDGKSLVYDKVYHPKGGLNGKVSCMIISIPG